MAGGSAGANMRSDSGRQDAVQPVTIKQLHDAKHDSPDDQYIVNGVSLQQVTLVARLSSVNMQVTMMSMQLDDGTGIMECVHMLPPDEDATSKEYALQKRQLLRDGAWARVVGRVVEVSGSRQVEAYRLRAVDDHNEITYHRLDTVRTFLAQTRPRQPKGMLQGNGNNAAMQFQAGNVDDSDGLCLDPGQRAVYDYAKQRHEAGRATGGENSEKAVSISVDDVVRDVQGIGNAQNAKQILDTLTSDGYLYTTLDNEHYAFCQV